MKSLLYPRLALDALKKNARLTLPYMLTSAFMVATQYILAFLGSSRVSDLMQKRGETLRTLMNFGAWVMLLFSAIFLFYIYSFLLKRRAREFGLYNVLGMGKNSLVRIISWEVLFISLISLAGGLLLGVALSKLAELGLMSMVSGERRFDLSVDISALIRTMICFCAVFVLIWLSACVKVRANTAIRLLKSESEGEKPPRANWILGSLGVIILAAAYIIAVSVSDPFDAIQGFFIAVIMVIVATYLIMIAFSVMLCRILKGNKKYYYNARHFVSVSQMTYRMKRNGAGLASVCVIATMVLVMLSSVSCLWYGLDDNMNTLYPGDINLEMRAWSYDALNDEELKANIGAVNRVIAGSEAAKSNDKSLRYIELSGKLDKSVIQCDYNYKSTASGELCYIIIVSAQDYAQINGKSYELAANEAAIVTDNIAYTRDSLSLLTGEARADFKVKSAEMGQAFTRAYDSYPVITVVVNDPVQAISTLNKRDQNGTSLMLFTWKYSFDVSLNREESIKLGGDCELALSRLFTDDGFYYVSVEIRELEREYYIETYGGLFFIGIMLSLVLLISAVLIIYYKQLAEGYEDKKRFEIMRKVGMTDKDIKRSVNSQLLIVFFAPLLLAAMHLGFAFPLISKLLTLFRLFKTGLFMLTTLITLGAFGVFYALIYRLTGRAYLNIIK